MRHGRAVSSETLASSFAMRSGGLVRSQSRDRTRGERVNAIAMELKSNSSPSSSMLRDDVVMRKMLCGRDREPEMILPDARVSSLTDGDPVRVYLVAMPKVGFLLFLRACRGRERDWYCNVDRK